MTREATLRLLRVARTILRLAEVHLDGLLDEAIQIANHNRDSEGARTVLKEYWDARGKGAPEPSYEMGGKARPGDSVAKSLEKWISNNLD